MNDKKSILCTEFIRLTAQKNSMMKYDWAIWRLDILAENHGGIITSVLLRH
jgi:hypothetical protein